MKPIGDPIAVENMRPNMAYEITYEHLFQPSGMRVTKTIYARLNQINQHQLILRMKAENGISIETIDRNIDNIVLVRPLLYDIHEIYIITTQNHAQPILQGRIDIPYHYGQCIVRLTNQNGLVYINILQIADLRENLANEADARLLVPAMQSGLDANAVFALSDAAEDMNEYRGLNGGKSRRHKQKSKKQRKPRKN